MLAGHRHFSCIIRHMDADLTQKRPAVLNKRQAKYVAARETGATRQQSAVMAGYSDTDKSGQHVENTPVVREELARARAELAINHGITKDDVLGGLKLAAETATTMADPLAMVRAWSEIGKMLGFYAPEVKRVEHGLDKASRDALALLPDDQLHKLAKGRVVDGVVVSKTEGPDDTGA